VRLGIAGLLPVSFSRTANASLLVCCPSVFIRLHSHVPAGRSAERPR
jgi:hypothetical protein